MRGQPLKLPGILATKKKLQGARCFFWPEISPPEASDRSGRTPRWSRRGPYPVSPCERLHAGHVGRVAPASVDHRILQRVGVIEGGGYSLPRGVGCLKELPLACLQRPSHLEPQRDEMFPNRVYHSCSGLMRAPSPFAAFQDSSFCVQATHAPQQVIEFLPHFAWSLCHRA